MNLPPKEVSMNVPILGQSTTFSVCPKGHVLEAPQHPVMVLGGPGGKQALSCVICVRCQFDWMVQTCAAKVLPRETTKAQADEAGRLCTKCGISWAFHPNPGCQEFVAPPPPLAEVTS